MPHARSTLPSLLPALAMLLAGATAASAAGAPATGAPAAAEPARLQLAQASVTAELQRELNALGYDAGPTDGLMGARTRAAIEGYQRDRGLLVDGQPSASLLEHVRASARAAAATRAPPPAAAEAEVEVVVAIQSELRRRGYQVPAVSGQLDEATRSAIRRYQSERRLEVDGEATPALLADLRRTAEPGGQGPDAAQIAAAQRALNERGYDAGPPDGTLGPRTRTAIRTFQADANRPPSGELDPGTLQRLGVIEAEAEAEPEPEAASPPADPVAPGYVLLLADDFADGDFTRDPAWRIAAGEFRIARGGINSSVTAPQLRSAEDVGRQLLGTVLQRQLGVTLPGQAAGAAAYLPVQIGPAFRLTAEVSARGEPPLQLELGPYRGQNPGHGYRLAYRSGEARPLQLVLVGEGGSSPIATAAAQLRTSGRHELRWERRADGLMTVALDGATVLEVRDSSLAGGFDGFSLVNAGGDWTLRSLRIEVPAD